MRTEGYYWVREKSFGWMVLYWKQVRYKTGVFFDTEATKDIWTYGNNAPEVNEYFQIVEVDENRLPNHA